MCRDVRRHADDAHSVERMAQEAGLPVLGKDAPGRVVRSGGDHMHVVAAGGQVPAEGSCLGRDARYFRWVVDANHDHTHVTNG